MEVWGGHESFRGAVSVPGHDVFVGCTPHVGDACGGDVYYVSSCSSGMISRFVLADVAGHGDAAAAKAGELRSLVRRYINTPDQSRLARALNRKFISRRVGGSDEGRFATALLISYFAPTDHAIICNAGHPRPLLYSAAYDRWQFLDADVDDAVSGSGAPLPDLTNLPLGVIDSTGYTQFAIRLQQGDLLVLYSDAFLEARSEGDAPWGEQGLLDVFRSVALRPIDPSELQSRVLAEIHRRTRTSDLDDDATMLVLHHNASNPPRQTLTERLVVLGRQLGLS